MKGNVYVLVIAFVMFLSVQIACIGWFFSVQVVIQAWLQAFVYMFLYPLAFALWYLAGSTWNYGKEDKYSVRVALIVICHRQWGIPVHNARQYVKMLWRGGRKKVVY